MVAEALLYSVLAGLVFGVVVGGGSVGGAALMARRRRGSPCGGSPAVGGAILGLLGLFAAAVGALFVAGTSFAAQALGAALLPSALTASVVFGLIGWLGLRQPWLRTPLGERLQRARAARLVRRHEAEGPSGDGRSGGGGPRPADP